ncbi:MAG: hypothetical protein K2G13_08930 [Muribaculaceae bacterium]|nr:hypothetical protein [Muribaculaceae bacterium]
MKRYLKMGVNLCLAIIATIAVDSSAGRPVELLAFSMPDGAGGMKLATRQNSD